MSAISAGTACDFSVKKIARIAERMPDAQWKIEDYVDSDCHILGYCFGGRAVYTIAGKEISISAGDILLIPQGLARSAHSDAREPWHFATIAFTLEFAAQKDRAAFSSLPACTHSDAVTVASLFREVCYVYSDRRAGHVLRSRSIIEQILYELVQSQAAVEFDPVHYACIQTAAAYIQQNFQRHLAVEELARVSNLSPSYFRLLFKKITGYTTVQYTNFIRINRAKALLLSGDTNVSQAAAQCGFSDIFYFSRAFKKITGRLPSDYLR